MGKSAALPLALTAGAFAAPFMFPALGAAGAGGGLAGELGAISAAGAGAGGAALPIAGSAAGQLGLGGMMALAPGRLFGPGINSGLDFLGSPLGEIGTDLFTSGLGGGGGQASNQAAPGGFSAAPLGNPNYASLAEAAGQGRAGAPPGYQGQITPDMLAFLGAQGGGLSQLPGAIHQQTSVPGIA